MAGRKMVKTVRRSFALPAELLAQLTEAAPLGLRTNMNRLVRTALEDFVARRRAQEFEAAMIAMAADPQIQAELAAIDAEFAPADADGLQSPPVRSRTRTRASITEKRA